MDSWYFLLGIMGLGMTSAVHPCPLTTHIAIVSFLSSYSQGQKRYWYIIMFMLGYCMSMFITAQIILSGTQSFASTARTMQSMSAIFLGPMLMIAGMFQLGWLPWQKQGGFQFWKKLHAAQPSSWLIFGMGALLAVAFCPATAVLFFVVAIPLMISSEFYVLGPVFYALGALLPLIAIVIIFTTSIGLMDRDQSHGRYWGRMFSGIAGVVLIILGFYLTLRDIYGY